jgi:hypothetical protein
MPVTETSGAQMTNDDSGDLPRGALRDAIYACEPAQANRHLKAVVVEKSPVNSIMEEH